MLLQRIDRCPTGGNSDCQWANHRPGPFQDQIGGDHEEDLKEDHGSLKKKMSHGKQTNIAASSASLSLFVAYLNLNSPEPSSKY